MAEMRHRYSRAFGVLGRLGGEIEEGAESASLDLAAFLKPDCIGEILHCMACDEDREFMEREFSVCFRYVAGEPGLLHAASSEDIVKLERRLMADYDRRGRDREYSFAIGAVRSAAGKFSRRQLKSGTYRAPAIHGDERLFRELLRLMSDWPARRSVEEQIGCRVRFQPPDTLLFTS